MLQSMVPYLDTHSPPMPPLVQSVQQAVDRAAAAVAQASQATQAAQENSPFVPSPPAQGVAEPGPSGFNQLVFLPQKRDAMRQAKDQPDWPRENMTKEEKLAYLMQYYLPRGRAASQATSSTGQTGLPMARSHPRRTSRTHQGQATGTGCCQRYQSKGYTKTSRDCKGQEGRTLGQAPKAKPTGTCT
jgi:hypothetical protein